MSAPVCVLGQGLAGSLLAWELMRRGIAVDLRDCGAHRSSSVGAGIINPITGQRLVASWRVAECLPVALRVYRELENTLGRRLVEPFRVWRTFATPRERETALRKAAAGELAPYVTEVGEDGLWIEGAYRVDTRTLVEALGERFRAAGVLRNGTAAEVKPASGPATVTLRAIGAGEVGLPESARLGLRVARGEILAVRSHRIRPGVILNRRHWVLPVGPGIARVGATFEVDCDDLAVTAAACEALTASAEAQLGGPVEFAEQVAGLRVTTPDKHPVAGWLDSDRRLGLLNGLGSKGALLAPVLAAQWADHLAEGTGFDPAVDPARFC